MMTAGAGPQRRPPRWPSRLRRVGVTIVVVLAVLLASGAVVQAVLTARDVRANPPPGRLINVGGHRLHL